MIRSNIYVGAHSGVPLQITVIINSIHGFFKTSKLNKIGLNSRIIKVALILYFGLIIAIAISLSLGAVPLSFQEIRQALLHRGSPINQTILWDVRLPRTLAAILVGAALGMSGTLLQGMLRNGLADPFLLEISAGSGLAAVALLTLGLFIVWVLLAAWIGAISTTLVVYLLARTRQEFRFNS